MQKYQQFKEKFDQDIQSYKGRIVITSHKNPDGDAVSSVLSLYHYLTEFLDLNNVNIFITGNTVSRYSSLDNYNRIQFVPDIKDNIKPDDLLIFLDSNNKAQFTKTDSDFPANIKILIDHHVNEPDLQFDMVFNPSVSNEYYSSTAEMLYILFFKPHLKTLSPKICRLLLLGIYSDMGNFVFINPDRSSAFVAAKELVDQGEISIEGFLSKFNKGSLESFHVLSAYLKNMRVKKIKEWPKFSYTFLTREEMKDYNEGDLSNGSGMYKGYINSVLDTNWGFMVKPSVEDSSWHLSFRSIPGSKESVNVRKIVENFNGGGHDMAAGGAIHPSKNQTLSAQDCLDKIFDYLKNNSPVFIDEK